MGRGSIRRGEARWRGFSVCRSLRRKLKVAYSGKGGQPQRYVCRVPPTTWLPAGTAFSFGGVRV